MSECHINRNIFDMKLWIAKRLTLTKGYKCCFIRSCTITANGHFVFADENNKRLVILQKDGSHPYEIMLADKPFDIESLGPCRVAVSYGFAKYVEILDIERKAVETRIKLKGFCSGISFNGISLVIMVLGHGIQILDVASLAITQFKTSQSHDQAIALSSSNNIYYTYSGPNKLDAFEMGSENKWSFSSPLFEGSQAIASNGHGNVFVAATLSSQVLAVSSDGKSVRKLLDDKQGIKNPSAICYDKREKMLLICNREDGRAFLYNLM